MRWYYALAYFMIGCFWSIGLLYWGLGSEKVEKIFFGWLPSNQIKQEILQNSIHFSKQVDCVFAHCLQAFPKNLKASIKEAKVIFSKSQVHENPKQYLLESTWENEKIQFTFTLGDSVILTNINLLGQNYCTSCEKK